MKLAFIFAFILATLIVYYIGLDQNSRPPNLRVGDAKMEFYKNMKVKLLKTTSKNNLDYSDVDLFADSIMVSNGYTKFSGWYFLNGEPKYFDELLHFSK